MGNINRTSALILIGLIAFSSLGILSVKPSNAQFFNGQIPAPEFTVQFVGHPYDVPVTIDPYTGATNAGFHVNNGTIVLTIKNPQYNLESHNIYNYLLCYFVQTKGHFSPDSNWTTIDFTTIASAGYNYQLFDNRYLEASSSQNTILSLPANGYPAGSQIDFQVQAVIANITQILVHDGPVFGAGHFETGPVLAEESNFSDTQTAKIPEVATTPTPLPSTPSPTPTANNFAFSTDSIVMVVIAVLLAVIVVLLLLRHRKPLPYEGKKLG
jgi:hypothetical protein